MHDFTPKYNKVQPVDSKKAQPVDESNDDPEDFGAMNDSEII